MRSRWPAVCVLALLAGCGSERCHYAPWLLGADLGDRDCADEPDGFCATAVGGSQAFRVGSLDAEPTGTIVVDGEIFAIVDGTRSDAGATLLARAAGNAIVALESDADTVRYTLSARPLARLSLVPPRSTHDTELFTPADLAAASTRVLVPADVLVEAFVALFAADGTRLVDDGLRVTLPFVTPPPLPPGAAWSAVRLPPTSASVVYDLALEVAGETARTVTVEVVDRADSLTPLAPPAPLTVGQTTELCVVARRGGQPILGAPLEFAVTAPLALLAHTAPGCALLGADEVGTGTVSVSGLGAEVVLSVTVAPTPPAR